MKLFIDDVRMPHDVGYDDAEFYVVTNWYTSRQWIVHNKPQFISFDHDLGEDSRDSEGRAKTGFDIAKWFVNADQRKPDFGLITKNFKFEVHSANPVGAENIRGLLNGYIKHKFGEQ